MPESLWQRFKRTAEEVQQPVENVLLQTLQGNLPPSLEEVTSTAQGELQPLQEMANQELWDLARSKVGKAQQSRHEALLQKNSLGVISQEEQAELDRLGELYDLHTLRKAYAYALLRWRGFPLPGLEASSSQ
jgi:hypothetical protein